jgi:hypothetical protein
MLSALTGEETGKKLATAAVTTYANTIVFMGTADSPIEKRVGGSSCSPLSLLTNMQMLERA